MDKAPKILYKIIPEMTEQYAKFIKLIHGELGIKTEFIGHDGDIIIHELYEYPSVESKNYLGLIFLSPRAFKDFTGVEIKR